MNFTKTDYTQPVKNGDGTYYIDKTKITDEQYRQLKAFYEKVNEYGRTVQEQDAADKKAREELEQLQRTWGTMK